MWQQVQRVDVQEWSEIEFSQLFLFKLCMSIEQPHVALTLPPDLEGRMQQAWATRVDSVNTSQLQVHVSECLGRLGVPHENEAKVGGLSVDMMLVEGVGQGGIVVEVDGPTHYCRSSDGRTRRELGPTVFKRRMLEGLGWKVVNVPYWEWDGLRNVSAAQDKYLLERLRGCGYSIGHAPGPP